MAVRAKTLSDMTDLDPQLIDLAREQDCLVALAQVTSAGIDRHQVRNDVDAGRLRRIHRGVYVAQGYDDSIEQVLRAAHMHLGPESTVILQSALGVYGVAGSVGRVLPQLAVPPGLEKRQRLGLDIHVWDLHPDEVSIWKGIPVTTIIRTLADCVRLLPRLQAVSCIDSALNVRAIAVDDLPLIADLLKRKRHCVAGRRRLAEARQGAQSPLETRVRLRASDAGFPPDGLQVPIRDPSGRLLGYGDMGYLLTGGRWLIVEADGRSAHDVPEALLYDRHRQNAFLASAGVSILRFAWEDTRKPETVPAALAPTLAAGGWRYRARP